LIAIAFLIGEERHQAFGADTVRRCPGDVEGRDDCGAIARLPWPRDGSGGRDDRLPEDTDGVRTRVARRGDEFIEDVVFL